MSVQIAGISIEHHDYDARGDVLYVSVAGCRATSPSAAPESPDRRRSGSPRIVAGGALEQPIGGPGGMWLRGREVFFEDT